MKNLSKISIALVFLALVLLLSIIGCGSSEDARIPQQTTIPPQTGADVIKDLANTPTLPTLSPAPILTLTPKPEPTIQTTVQAIEAKVIRVVDGDTIEIEMNGTNYKVRYIGIDTPETVDPRKPVQPYGPEASAKNKELVDGKVVKLVKDVSETDQYGRLLRYVYIGDLFVNAELVRLGYAQVSTYPPDVKYQDYFLQLQEEARDAGRGLWGIETPVQSSTPTPTSTQTSTPTPTVAPTSELTLEIVSVTSPVQKGSNATLQAKTAPGADCAITVYYKSGPSSASGLYPKKADSTGNVSWTWEVGTRTTSGSWPITVSAVLNGKTATKTINFTVY